MRMRISRELTTIIVSIFLFVTSFIFKNISLPILIITYLLISYRIFIKVIKNLGKGIIFDENFLMVIATLGAFAIGENNEAVAVMLFYQIGEYMNDLGIDKSKESIKKLIDKRDNKVTQIKNDEEVIVNPLSLKKNDIIVIRPGERVPVDGIVVEGESNVDTSSITGESLLRNIKVNDVIYSGFVSINGILKIKVTDTYNNSLVSRILKVITDSEIDKSNTEKFITKFAKIYTPIVVISALLIFIIPSFILGQSVKVWAYRSLIFLVASCPCALVLSIPLGYFCGIGVLSKKGILVKSSGDLEMANKISSFVFDKTGTLTEGAFELLKVNPNKVSKSELISIVNYAEYYSNHPIAIPIKKAYKKKIDTKIIKNFKEKDGGISVDINNDKVLVGNYDFLKKNKIDFLRVAEEGTIIYVAKNKEYIGNIIIGDKIKKEALEVISYLKNNGYHDFAILSGDNDTSVSLVAKKLKIKEYRANLKPLDKKDYIANLKQDKKVCFVGDGINDAIVLLEANLGVSMGKIGSDVAIEASDVVIMNDNLHKIIDLIKVSKYTNKIVYQNIIFALLVKLIVLLLGVLGISTIILAVFADIGVTFITVLNSLKIFCKKM